AGVTMPSLDVAVQVPDRGARLAQLLARGGPYFACLVPKGDWLELQTYLELAGAQYISGNLGRVHKHVISTISPPGRLAVGGQVWQLDARAAVGRLNLMVSQPGGAAALVVCESWCRG